jgi:uroporphyrinogen-III synthase
VTPRILVTRPADQADELCDLLRAGGFEPVAVPTVEIDRASTVPAVDAMLADLDGADWLVITSANGAAAVADRLAAGDRSLPPSLRVAAVGPATAGALADAGVPVDHVPDRYLTVAIAGGLGAVAGRRVVLARADAATTDLRDALVAAGAQVEEVVAYRTIEGPAASRDPLHTALNQELAGIAFTSSSTVRGLLHLAAATDRQRARAVPAFCIGPVTATTAQRAGFDVEVVAEDHTASGLADAIVTHLADGDR